LRNQCLAGKRFLVGVSINVAFSPDASVGWMIYKLPQNQERLQARSERQPSEKTLVGSHMLKSEYSVPDKDVRKNK
jgi:hypothetical protein